MYTTFFRRATGTAALVVLGALTACAPYPRHQQTYPQAYPQNYPQTSYPSTGYQNPGNAPYGTEYGRVVNIEVLQSQGRSQSSGVGTVLGAVVGGVLGNQVGRGSGRAAATALGAIGGAVVGNQIEGRNQPGEYPQGYRMTIQLDQGGMRAYDVTTPGDVRVGDRVSLYNGQISRM
ncbi:glycine zipper 2TM domain-containing protein [Simplicispira psychrophila]|uniref:glycine zipper 2TM domain-containing protein n=1 Tax=Simplicispira psychrophila TaxID=80882 RepID=UPI000482D509|nr:glycine zipper 2TM domain-containing protein [Simplicispira psychrophila]